MSAVLLILVVVLVVASLVFGVMSLLSGDDPGLAAAEPDERAAPLPNNRSLKESDLKTVRFDVGWRGYRMVQVDRVLRRTAYDIGYKDEMIAVLEAEVAALRDGRIEDAELLRKARESAASPSAAAGLVAGAAEDEAAAGEGETAAGEQEASSQQEAAPEQEAEPEQEGASEEAASERAEASTDGSERDGERPTADQAEAPVADRA
jgi:DivIVA domain-containing protein